MRQEVQGASASPIEVVVARPDLPVSVEFLPHRGAQEIGAEHGLIVRAGGLQHHVNNVGHEFRTGMRHVAGTVGSGVDAVLRVAAHERRFEPPALFG